MAALGWLLNLFFRGGGFNRGASTNLAVQAVQGIRLRPAQLQARALQPQRVQADNLQPEQFGKGSGLAEGAASDSDPTDEWTHIILDGDYVSASTANPATLFSTGLLWTPEPDKTYWFKCHLTVTQSGTVGTESGFSWPTNLTRLAILLESATASAATAFPACAWGQNDENAAAPFADPISVQLGGAHTAGALSHVTGEGIIITSSTTTGSLEVRINRAAAGGAGTTHTLKAGSWLAWQEVPRA